jgi:hypothetical protein
MDRHKREQTTRHADRHYFFDDDSNHATMTCPEIYKSSTNPDHHNCEWDKKPNPNRYSNNFGVFGNNFIFRDDNTAGSLFRV